jgi:proton-dependent oligopeptide transporter, POT family
MSERIATAKHPKGLYVLFFTELWERFGFYLMIGILFLYLTDTTNNGGWGFTNARAIDIVGSYTALVYLTPFIGGLIADRYLGYVKSVLLGGSMLALGYFLLAIHGSIWILYLSLLCIIIGNGFFKPNVSTLLGNLYNTEALKSKMDSGYNIFYMGINTGAFICNFVAAYLRNHYTWGAAFAAAGVGMVISIVWFAFGSKYVRSGDVMKPARPDDMPFSRITLSVFLPALVAGVIGWTIKGNLLGSDSNDAFIFASIPVIGFFVWLWLKEKNQFDKRRLGTLLTLFAAAVIFWNIYNQNSTALTIWAETYTSREVPESSEAILKPFGFLQTVNTKPKEVPAADRQFRSSTDANGNVITTQGLDPYLQNLPKAEWPAPGKDLKLVSTEIYQSVSPFWIITLTPVLIAFFSWLRSRGKEPTTPGKMAWGVTIAGLSSIIMIIACLSTDIYENKVSSAWIISSYGVYTIGELFISPIGLSLVSKVAPRRFTSLMMGGWLLTISLGAKTSGILAGFWDQIDQKAIFFTVSAVAAIAAGIIIFPMVKRLNKVVVEATTAEE